MRGQSQEHAGVVGSKLDADGAGGCPGTRPIAAGRRGTTHLMIWGIAGIPLILGVSYFQAMKVYKVENRSVFVTNL